MVIIQHLDPTHESMLSEILSRETPLPVRQVTHPEPVKADHVYVIPPDAYLELSRGELILTEPAHTRGARKAIDHFFRSLARECGDRCAGIVLSGSGTDGTAGLRAIRAAGGLALAQDPDTAEHSSMPASAIEAGVIDKVLKVEDMPGILQTYIDHPLTIDTPDQPPDEAADALEEVIAILKNHEDFNLHQYKTGTAHRRIARRMSLTGIDELQDYHELLRNSEEERHLLTKDLLINVTDFFRDPDAFAVLEKEVLPEIIRRLKRTDPIRVWVPGCATGEEAYSLAILLLETREKLGAENEIRIFATDIDRHAISIARKGVYPASIAGEMPGKYLRKYFTRYKDGDKYCVSGQVRDLISFAAQNVAVDPPFSRMHLISCRNLLIYLKKEIQRKIFNSFYFALDGESYLFLGSSETINQRTDMFRAVDQKWRIYQKIPGRDDRRAYLDYLRQGEVMRSRRTVEGPGNPARPRRSAPSRTDQIRQSVLAAMVPPTVVVDQEGQVLYYHGDVKPYLYIPTGEPRFNILQLVLPALRSRIRTGLYKVRRNREKLSIHGAFPIGDNEQEQEKRIVRIDLVPLKEQDFTDGPAIAIVFLAGEELSEQEEAGLTQDDNARAQLSLEQELAETKEELQNTIEELETSTEELKASHEEALSTNEELQSANEELEASSEELRSLNEELSTVNNQLKEKIEQLQSVKNDVENFFTSTNVPTIFLNPDLEIQRYTPAAEHLLKMGPRDIGRPIYSLGRELVDDDLTEECRQVLRDFQPVSKEKTSWDGRHFIRKVVPYRTEDRKIEGVVLLFQEVTEIRELSRRALARERQQAVVARIGMLALGGAEPLELMHQAVRQVAHVLEADYCKVLKYQPEQKNLLMVAGVGWQEGLVGKATVPDDQNSQAGYTLLAQDPVIVTELATERRFQGPDLLIEHEVVSGISCVINHSDPPYGVLGVHTRKLQKFTDEDANFIVSVANMLSTALRAKETQERLHNSEVQFRTMANSIPQLAWMADADGNIYWYNQRWYDYTGTTEAEVIEWGWQKVHHPDHVERVVRQIRESFAAGEPWEDTFPLRSQSGRYRWFLSRAKPIRDQQGRVVRWFGTNTDITEQREYERHLRESDQKLRIAMNINRIGTYEHFLPSGQAVWDQLLREKWGIARGEAVTERLFYSAIHPEDQAPTRETIEKALAPDSDGQYHASFRVINRQSGQLSWIETSGQVFFEDGQPVKMIGLARDITEKKEAERTKELLSSIVRSSDDAIISADLDGMITSWNRGAERLFGFNADEATGQPLSLILPQPKRQTVLEAFRQLREGEMVENVELYFRNKQGDELEVAVTVSPLQDQQGNMTGSSMVIRDISSRKALEVSLRAAIQELEVADRKKNEFLAILGHELRNPLAALAGSVDLIEQGVSGPEELIDIMQNSIDRMSKLLDDLLDLSRVSRNRLQLDMQRVDLGRVLQMTLEGMRKSFNDKQQKLEVDIAEGLHVNGDPTRLEQIFANLLVNAGKYTPEKGQISVKALQEDNIVIVTVADNGIGMEAKDIRRIFDPFYQITPEDKAASGLGIGLALAKNLTELHDGIISAYSDGHGRGATFRVQFPAAPAADNSTDEPEKRVDMELPPGIQLVLVEDNEAVMMTFSALLRNLGCEVHTAETGRRGLELIREIGPDAALIDIGLPDLNGIDVAAQLRREGFSGLLIAVSGYSHEEARQLSGEAGFDHHLAKPARLPEVVNLLAEARR